MGQKTPPVALRLCLNRSFDSSWFHENYSLLLHQDQVLRSQIHSILKSCGLISGRVSVQFFPKKTLIHACLHDTGRGVRGSGRSLPRMMPQAFGTSTSLPGQKLTLALLAWSRQSRFPIELISTQGNPKTKAMTSRHADSTFLSMNSLMPSSVQSLNHRLTQLTGGQIHCLPLKIDSKYSSAHFLCGFLCQRLQEGLSFRSLVQQILQEIRHCPQIRGFRLQCSGRLGGVELARVESKTYGRTSLHVYSERIDYAAAPAWTASGLLGVKVWISFTDDC